MELLNIFEQLSNWITEIVTSGIVVTAVCIVVTIFRKKGINIKLILSKASDITEEIGEAFLATSNAFDKADAAIKDNGRLKENSVKDVIAAGKHAIIEWKDVIIEIKPKKNK